MSTSKMSTSALVICVTLTITSITLITCTKAPETKTDKATEATSDPKATMDNSKTMINPTMKMDNVKDMIDSKAMMDNSKTMMDSKSIMVDTDSNDYDLMAVMAMCNESFRIEVSYLMSLNESGSFPDETEKTPKCYLRCMLENLKIASLEDGKLDPQRAAVVFAGTRNGEAMDDIQEMTTACAEHRDEVCHCEMAYNFLKCLFSMEIEKYTKSKS